MEERLNKLLARAGAASRRGADDLIASGRVSVNGKVVTTLGTRADPEQDEIRLDGERIHPNRVPLYYLALNKPREVITTVSDPFGRPTVMDLVPDDVPLFPVGRLDGNSEGLLLMTNDGDLANQLSHPRFEHEKEYRVKISSTPTEETLRLWRDGIMLEDGITLPAQVRLESSTGPGSWVRFVLREGRNQQIRRMIEARRHKVHKLVRIRVGPIRLGDLRPGRWRTLTEPEVAALRAGSNEPPEPEGKSARKRASHSYKTGWARPRKKPGRPKRRGGKGKG